MLEELYPGNAIVWRHAGPWFHLYKINRALAQVHEAVLRHDRDGRPLASVATELADLLAWILAVWVIAFPGESLDRELAIYYRKGCPKCETRPCACGLPLSRGTDLVDEGALRELREYLESLRGKLPDHEEGLEKLERSVEAALNDYMMEPVSRRSLEEAAEFASSVQETAPGKHVRVQKVKDQVFVLLAKAGHEPG